MKPLLFGTSDRPLFGIYHPPSGSAPTRGAVVLCPPFGGEYVNAHRAMRQLAGLLVASGFHVLRFDYFGTGDSGGNIDQIDLNDLIYDVSCAVDELCAVSAMTRVRLIGLRLGGLVAAQACETLGDRVEALVLWDTVVSGRTYIAEFALDGCLPGPDYVQNLEAFSGELDFSTFGFAISKRMASQLRAVELARHAHVMPFNTFAITSQSSEHQLEIQEALSAAPGGVCTVELYRSFPCWLDGWPVTVAAVPVDVIGRIAAWLRDVPTLPPLLPATACHSAGDTAIRGQAAPRARETPVRFGTRPEMVGIVTSPGDKASGQDRPTIIALNTGIAHRVGHYRLYVDLARRLAGLGHVVLRFDFSGIGDSERRDDSLLPFESSQRDLGEAVDFMAARYGCRTFILVGLCSGADNALVYASKDSRIVGSVLIDPSIPPTPRYYLNSLAQRLKHKRSWLNALVNPSGAIRKIQKIGTGTPPGADKPELDIAPPIDLRTPEIRNFLRDCFAAIVDRDAKLFTILTGGFLHRHNYKNQLVDAFPEIDFRGRLRLTYNADSDHLFRATPRRRELFEDIESWLTTTEFTSRSAEGDQSAVEVEYF